MLPQTLYAQLRDIESMRSETRDLVAFEQTA